MSPLNVAVFSCELVGHPNQQAMAHGLNGLQNGFRLGFEHPHKHKSPKKNKSSAFCHPKVIGDYLANYLAIWAGGGVTEAFHCIS